jgi:D-aminopeptidase
MTARPTPHPGVARLGAGLLLLLLLAVSSRAAPADRHLRARQAGVEIGILEPGPLNAITDVAGVAVGHVTLVEGRSTRTGVTAIVPHRGNLYQSKVPAGYAVANGYGKFMGSTQIEELGEIESPILLTNTLSVPEAAAAAIEWTLAQAGNAEVQSVNAVVGETNDGTLNDIRARRVTKAHGRAAIEAARPGPVVEGAVGAGTGTVAFGWKGGIGTSSRRLPAGLGGYTVGVLVQSNYGGVLSVNGVPAGRALGQHYLRDELSAAAGDGSVIVVVATDAPLSDRNLKRLANRAFIGIGRTGSPITNGSGDYAVAFSTSERVRRTPARREAIATVDEVPNGLVSPLFQAVAEATEEAVLNSMFAAGSMEGNGARIEGLPVDKVMRLYLRSRAGF